MQVYLSAVVGDGTPRRSGQAGNPYRPKVFDYKAQVTQARVIELPSNAQGHPLKNWVIVEVDATDFGPLDADPDMAAITDLATLDDVPGSGKVTTFNQAFAKNGIAYRATVGDSYRTIINGLLAELGSSVRL